MTAWNLCLGTGLATVVYHFRGWGSGADTFASRCPQGPISVPGPGPEARPQVGTTVALAPLPHARCWCQGRNPLDACTFTDLSPPTPPGFRRVEDTFPKSLGSEGLWVGAVVTRQVRRAVCVCTVPLPATPSHVCYPGLMKTSVAVGTWDLGDEKSEHQWATGEAKACECGP